MQRKEITMEETKNNSADVCEEQASETVEEKVDVEETINEEEIYNLV